jgi:hypothetical protein
MLKSGKSLTSLLVATLCTAMLSVMFVTDCEAQVAAGAENALSKVKPTFLENKGQWDLRAKYLLRPGGVDMWVTDQGVVYDLHKETHTNSKAEDAFQPMTPQSLRENHDEGMRTGHVVEMKFEHMLTAEAETLDVLPGTTNYFIGNDSTKWVTGARTYSGVTMKHIYSGVDARFYLENGVPRYDLIVQPGADPKSIQMKFTGQTGMKADANGNLLIETSMGNIEERGLFAYQIVDGAKQRIACSFRVWSSGRVTFNVGAFDKSQPLTIDPLVYSTFLGANDTDYGESIAVDVSGFAYVAGHARSTNFPVTVGAYQTSWGRGGPEDAFVSKLSVDGASLVYSSYLGGDSLDFGYGIAVDGSSHAYVTGYTHTLNFPTTKGAYQRTKGGYNDAFVTKFSVDGASLVYSTYLGGAFYDIGYSIAVDESGNAYVTGTTASTNFPTTIGADQTTNHGSYDAFVSKLSADGASLIYSTYLGGDTTDIGYDIAVDGSGNAYVVGNTSSKNFQVTSGAYQAVSGGVDDAFVTKLSVDGASLVYSTFLGGDTTDMGRGISVDRSGNAYVTGKTYSKNFPVTVRAYQTLFGGVDDAFVTKFSVDGASLLYSTYLGGSSFDEGYGIAVDGSGNAYVTGYTYSKDFPATARAYQPSHTDRGNKDAFVTKLSVDGSSRDYSTYLGGTSDDAGYGIALDGSGNAYVTGFTSSSNFPRTKGAYQTWLDGNSNAFITKLSPNGSGTDAVAEADLIPAGLTLHQNTPNPFSDRTTIEYSLPTSALVTLTIYDELGQKIATLVNSREDAGPHSVAFDAAHLINGTYFYRLAAGSESVSGKMTLFR